MPLLLIAVLLLAAWPGTLSAQTCVPGKIATGYDDPKLYPTQDDLHEYLPVDPPEFPGDPVDPPISGECTHAWSPDIGEFCNSSCGILPPGITGPTDRISCGEDATMVISEHQGYPLSLMLLHKKLPPPFQSVNAMQVSMQLYYPPDFNFTSGRLPLGIKVGTGEVSGGELASKQTGSSIRLRIGSKGGRLGIYSYHLDRTTKVYKTKGQFGTVPELKQYGQGAHMKTPIPKGEWITVVMEMTLGNGGWGQDSSAAYMYNSAGKLIGSTGFSNVTYNLSDWKFDSMFGDTKQKGGGTVSQDQAFLIKNYQGNVCNI